MRRNGLARGNAVPVNCPYSACIAQYAVQFIKHPLQTRRQLLPRLGQHHLTRSAIQQSDAGLPLQLFYAMTDRRLAQSILSPARLKLLARATVIKIRS